ncbi:MAG TPA: LON peptidase substrate-binding domain-containing protein [Phycisphaerales bacterium]|nr:LON peptidase substrate-binding domain-containing protein [Phycisphaerales bacterium]
MSDPVTINFGKPIPLFPLEAVALLPQQVIPLHIFEPRYRQMVQHALDSTGLIAMAIFEGSAWRQQYHGRPEIRPAVCVGHIVRHEALEGGRFNVLLQGVCRARVVQELPASEERLYRVAMLEPMGDDEGELSLDDTLNDARSQITTMLADGPLAKLAAAEPVLEYLRNDEIPTHALLEIVSVALATDPAIRYQLLAEPDAKQRARVLLAELTSLARLVRLAQLQQPESWPKGASWN